MHGKFYKHRCLGEVEYLGQKGISRDVSQGPAMVEFTTQQAQALMPPTCHISEGVPQRFRSYRMREKRGERAREHSRTWREMGKCATALKLARLAWADHVARGGDAAPEGHAYMLADRAACDAGVQDDAESGAARSAVGDADAHVDVSPLDQCLAVPEAPSSEQCATPTERNKRSPTISGKGSTVRGRRRRADPRTSERTTSLSQVAEERGRCDQPRQRGRRAVAAETEPTPPVRVRQRWCRPPPDSTECASSEPALLVSPPSAKGADADAATGNLIEEEA